jgi:hypothetical protein
MYGVGPHGSVLAVGAVLTHLLSNLVMKGILSTADVQSILADATNELIPRRGMPHNKEALDVVGEIMKRFP